jgi:3-mercaptopyruvate sulfurtransferase SseA
MIGVGLALILGAAAWYVIYAPSAVSSEPTAPVGESVPYPDVPRISLGDAKAAYDTQSAVFIDVRGEPYYSEGHIPGARSITEEELPNHINELNPSQWIITYCT